MKFQVGKFDGQTKDITEEQAKRLEKVLLETGKYVKIGDDIINISDIRHMVAIKEKNNKTVEEDFNFLMQQQNANNE